jgi:hypothetical protein
MSEIVPAQSVQNRIYRIRGQQVMLDVDLAELYNVETGKLNRAVNRNSERFPEDFMFQLNRIEIMRISQIGISSRLGVNIKFSKRVTVFTEQGIAMLSGVLRSPRSIQVNIAIMRAFVKMRHAMLAHQGIARRVEKLEGKVSMLDTDVRLIVQDIDRLMKTPRSVEKRIKGFSKDS